jgi:hypothetical protein
MNRLFAFATLIAFVPLAIGCAPEAAPEARGDVRVSLTGPDGSVHEEVGSFDQMVGPALLPMPALRADGNATTDVSVALVAAQLEIELLDGSTLVLAREGQKLERVGGLPEGVQAATSIEWSDDLQSLRMHGAEGTTTIQVEGIEDRETRARYLGYTAILALGGHVGLGGQEVGRIDPVITPIVIVALALLGVTSYGGCIFGGTRVCGDEATRQCGEGNVKDFKTVCGVGFDVAGKFHVGYDCSFMCK